MRRLIAAAAFGLLAVSTPALAETLKELTTHGMVMTIQGMEIEVKYTPDGKFSALDGQITGAWKIDGDKLCTTSNFSPEETCAVYPKDKKSGDTFDLTTEQGTATIHIK
jgi:hypothetical protein